MCVYLFLRIKNQYPHQHQVQGRHFDKMLAVEKQNTNQTHHMKDYGNGGGNIYFII